MSANADASHKLTDAMNARDIEAIKAVFVADSVFRPGKSGVLIEGVDAVTDSLVAWLDAHETYSLETVREFYTDDEGYNEWRFTAKTLDGQPVETHGVDYFRFEDGKIAEKSSFRKM